MSDDIFDAIEAHDTGHLRRLLKSGADPNAVRSAWPRLRPLHAAIAEMEEGGSLEQVELLLQHGADINGTYPDVGGSTPLLLALYNGNHDAIRFLLQAGADPNVRSDEGDSPLRWSAEESDVNIARILLSRGAYRTINDYGGISGKTALGIAVGKLDIDMTELLLNAGADIRATDLDYRVAKDYLPAPTEENAALRDKITQMVEFKR